MAPALYRNGINLDNYTVQVCLRTASCVTDAIEGSNTSVSVCDVQELD